MLCAFFTSREISSKIIHLQVASLSLDVSRLLPAAKFMGLPRMWHLILK